MLNTPVLSPRDTERHAQELIYLWIAKYFTGQPHFSQLGDATFPVVDVFFNQTQIDSPTDKPQLHFIFSGFRPVETWWATGNLGDWQRTISTVGSGVSYGVTSAGLEESVHGKLARHFVGGTDIRWQQSGDDLIEEVRIDGTWTAQRTLAGADGIRWRRVAGNYLEEIHDTASDAWLTARTIGTTNSLWDGSKKLVTCDTTILLFIRTINAGDTQEKTDHTCRRLADNVKELLQDEQRRADLVQKGFRRIQVVSGPTPMASSGYQTRLLTIQANMRYFLPRQS